MSSFFRKLTNLQLFIVVGFLLLLAFVLIGGYFYLNSMQLTNGNLNINKIKKIDKTYTYSIYSDFYFRIIKFDEFGDEVSSYSSLIPTKTNIGYKFEEQNITRELSNEDIGGKIIIDDSKGKVVESEIELFNTFAKTFGEIIATQDEHYFIQSAKSVGDILKKLYNFDLEKKISGSVNDYYIVKDSAIDNLKLKHFKFSFLNESSKEAFFASRDNWSPNIIEWNFNENDQIYLQLLNTKMRGDIESYMREDSDKKSSLIVKTIKMHDNKITPLFFKVKLKENKIETLFLDSNGYAYVLIMKNKNQQALKKYLTDYLKIAYGLHFVDIKEFKNDYYQRQLQIKRYKNEIESLIMQNIDLEAEIGEELLKHFEFSSLKKYENLLSDNVSYNNKFKLYKEYFNEYPSANLFSLIKKELQNRELLLEAKKNIKIDLLILYRGAEKIRVLKEKCKNIECINKLKSNDWR